MTSQEAAALLDVLIKKAPGLRAAGISALELGEVKVMLTPVDVADDGKAHGRMVQSGDPLKDHALYGLGAGDRLPGYEIDDDQGR